MSKAPIRIGLQPGARQLYIERYPEEWLGLPYSEEAGGKNYPWREIGDRATKVAGYWLLPQSTNKDRTLGIFLKLYDNGKIERVTVRDDEADDVVLIKPPDGET